MEPKKYTWLDFCKDHDLSPEWLASPEGHLTIDASTKRLPEDRLVVGGDVLIQEHNHAQLPDQMIVGGDLEIVMCHSLTSFPTYLEVKGDIIVVATPIQSIHEGCHFGGSVSFINAWLRYLPDHFHVHGNLQISGCPIPELPSGLVVDERLDISRTAIRIIPGDTRFRSLIAADSKLMCLQDYLHVVDLDISGCPILWLPKGLVVEHRLNISRTAIPIIPDDSRFRSLIAAGSKLLYLRDALQVVDLDISGCPILWLPKGLVVERRLNISRTAIRTIPGDTRFCELIAAGSKLEYLPEQMEVDVLDIEACSIYELPPGIIVFFCLNISHTPIQRIHKVMPSCKVIARYSQLKELPDPCTLFHLDLTGCAITTLPTKMLVFDSLVIVATQISALPVDCVVRGTLKAYLSALATLPEHIVLADSLLIGGTPIKKVPAGVICPSIHCDPEVQVDAYRFDRTKRFDFHPNGRYVLFENNLAEIEEKSGNAYRCRSVKTHEEYYILLNAKAS